MSTDPSQSRLFHIENLGCAKNQVDAESMIAALENHSLTMTSSAEEADLIIVNSCGFLEDARRESIDVTLELKTRFPDKRIILAGCLSQRGGTALSESLPEADGIFGNRAPGRIGEIVDEVFAGRRTVLLPESYEEAPPGAPAFSIPGSSYLKIAEGCDNRCSFCSIPLIRGALRSRPEAAVLTDAARLIDSGVREINLIAQDLGSYGKDIGDTGIAGLLEKILRIPGNFWIRLLYIHPDNFPLDILRICKGDSRLLPYFDIPFQHASERILREMGRTGNAESYSELISNIRETLPDAVIRTTLLLGYPGEGRRDFRVLQEFQRSVEFDWLGAFRYSRERGTRAYSKGVFPGIAHRLKRSAVRRRFDTIIARQQSITAARLERFVGSELDVFIEEPIEGEELFFGRIYAQAPEVDGLTVVHADKAEPGSFVRCRIAKVNGIDLEATPV